jgi:cellulose 1,4-beta-cellobiosidase
MKIFFRFCALLTGLFPVAAVHGDTACKVSLLNFWDDNYQLDVRVTNTGTVSIDSWSVTLDFSEPAAMTGGWNARLWNFDSTITAGNCCDWNGRLAPGQSASFGIQGKHDGSFDIPACSNSSNNLNVRPAGGNASSSSGSSSSGGDSPGSSSSGSPSGDDDRVSSASSDGGAYPKSAASTGGIDCTVKPTGIWNNGYQLDVIVNNNSVEQILGWSLTLTFDEPAQISQSWGANLYGGSTATVSASNMSWNGNVAPGESAYFSLQGKHDGSFELPTCSVNK